MKVKVTVYITISNIFVCIFWYYYCILSTNAQIIDHINLHF